MRVGIVGAGISGLACGRELTKAGFEVTIFEKSKNPGGRIHTRVDRLGYVWDTGASSIAPRGKAIEKVLLGELCQDSLIKVALPIYVHDALRVSRGEVSKNSVPRYTFTTGNQELPRLLASDLDVKYDCQVEELTECEGGYRILNEDFDYVVLTPPVPQTAQLLWTLDESRPLANSRFRPCLSIMFGFATPNPDVSYHALIDPEQSHPMTWLSIESVKSPCRAADSKSAIVVHLSARFSLEHYMKDDSWIIATAHSFIKHLFGSAFGQAEVAMVKKWKYSQPENLARFEAVNQPGSKLLIAGDGLLGGRIEDAYECGVRVAGLIHNA